MSLRSLAVVVVSASLLGPAAFAKDSSKSSSSSSSKSDKDSRKSDGKSDGKSDKKKSSGDSRPKSPPSLTLESIDIVLGRATVRVGGLSKAPDARVFQFHDDRERHFIALYAQCELAPPPPPTPTPLPSAMDAPPATASDATPTAPATDESEAPKPTPPPTPPNDELRCQLEVPRAYLVRGNVVAMTVRISGREVSADPESVKAKFAAARAAIPAGAVLETPPTPALTGTPPATDDVPHPPGVTPSAGAPEDPGVTLPSAKKTSAPEEGADDAEGEGGEED